MEVTMSEDAHGSGLVSLLWGFWIYWIVSFWCEYLSSLSRAKESQQARQARPQSAISPSKRSAGYADLEALVSRILQRCGGIAVNEFLNARLAAYESIVAAFDSGDRRALRKQVSSEVYNVFSEAIAAREGRQEQTETLFAWISPPEIVAALLDETHAEISIRFVADSFKLSRRPSGQLIERMPDKRHSVDVWTFGCTSSSLINKWCLIATETER